MSRPSPRPIERLYQQVLPGSGQRLDVVARSLQVEPDVLLDQLGTLIELDVVRLDDDGVLTVVPLREAVVRFWTHHAAELGRMSAEVSRLIDVVPVIGAGERAPGDDHPAAIAGEVAIAVDVPALLATWMAETDGDVCFLRPDQWQLPSESQMAVAVARAVARGRRVRAIYPARALQEAPEVLVSRASLGEQIRVVPHVMTRMAIVGPVRAIVPEPLGRRAARRLVVRQRSLVAILQAWFDQMWESADPLPDRGEGAPGPDPRGLLLAQMADGLTDEAIARNLGVSLRTVRRRVAALMAELGVDTRFQAGIEAVRRGWL